MPMRPDDPFILASASPRRRELLGRVVADFAVEEADVEEVLPADCTGREAVMLLAGQKARAVAARHAEACWVLGADTMVELDGTLLGKPRDDADAARMLRALSGHTHRVHTGMCIIHGGEERTVAETTEVTFAELTEEEIAENIASGEPAGKAGAYGIQFSAAAWVTGIRGCYYNVVGLPLARLRLELMAMAKGDDGNAAQ